MQWEMEDTLGKNLDIRNNLMGFYNVLGNWGFLGPNLKNILAYKK